MRSSAILNIENIDKNCFIWSVLASIHPCENDHPNRVSNYNQNFNEINIDVFDLTNGFKCSDIYRFEKLNNLSIIIYEKNFCQDGDNWKHNLLPIETSKNESDKVIDLIFYKNHYALIKNLHVFLGNHINCFVCRQCLNSYTNESTLINHKENCGDNICTVKTSPESHLHWKNIFVRIHYILRLMQILRLITRSMVLV